jgi:hypothetical protein
MSEPRVFWATQNFHEQDGIYLMSEDAQYIEKVSQVEIAFKVIEKSVYDQALKERDEALALVDELEGVLKSECWCPIEFEWDQEVIVCRPCKALEKIAQFKGGKK